MSPGKGRRPIHWIASSQKDMRQLPDDVKDVFGSALLDAQYGDKPVGARPFGEGLAAAIWKLAEDHDGDTYRAAYTAAFPKAVYVLHVFKKKSKHGIATPKPDKQRDQERFEAAARHYSATYLKGTKR